MPNAAALKKYLTSDTRSMAVIGVDFPVVAAAYPPRRGSDQGGCCQTNRRDYLSSICILDQGISIRRDIFCR